LKSRLPLLVALGLCLAAPAGGHQRSQSFSTWRLEGTQVRVVWSVLAFEATRLPGAAGREDDLGALVAAHLAARVAVTRGGTPCAPEGPPRPLRARPGHLRVEAAFRCPEAGALVARSDAFFDLAPSHVHFARVVLAGAGPREVLFTGAERAQTLVAAEGGEEAAGAGFRRYVGLGVEHILIGYDHLAFLLSLILLGGGLRELGLVVTGFTLGHSVTLSLAALGWVHVDGALVEALIGYSIALVAAENLAVRAHAHGLLARAAAAVLATLAGLSFAGWPRAGPPAATLLGLALFSACYLALAARSGGSRRFRPAITLLFGLVHGFGFASVLAEIGLPRERLVAGLVGFNLGVELGQLVAVVAILAVGRLARSLAGAPQRVLAADALSAVLCALGLFWFFGRAYG
jgi:hypothetical protein